jgi:hypothetical protein
MQRYYQSGQRRGKKSEKCLNFSTFSDFVLGLTLCVPMQVFENPVQNCFLEFIWTPRAKF